LKNIGEVQVKVPCDRAGEFKTVVFPRSKQYEEEISRDLGLLLGGGSEHKDTIHDIRETDREEDIFYGNQQRQQGINGNCFKTAEERFVNGGC
jgi:hypothetical protein